MIPKLLKHPFTVILAVAAGVSLGIYNRQISDYLGIANLARSLAVPGELYMFFLQMTVIPIIITAIASSLAKLIRNKHAAGSLGKMIAVFLVCVALVSALGMALGMFGEPGLGLDAKTKTMLGSLISSPEGKSSDGVLSMSLKPGNDPAPVLKARGIVEFLMGLVPSNIFTSLTMGSTLAIVFFSIIFGVAIGCLKEESSLMLIGILSAIFEAFQTLIKWSLYLLPFGLICLLADQIARVGPEIFVAMSKFIMLFYAGGAGIFLLATIVIWAKSGIRNPFKVLAAVFEPVLIALATRNSMATLPSAITALDKRLGFDEISINLTLPLGMTIGRFGNIFYFGLASFFVTQIYSVDLTSMQYAIVFLGVIFAGTATAGASGIVTLSVISIVLNPLGLPVEAILIIFMAIDPIIDPIRTFIIVYVNMMASALIADRSVRADKGWRSADGELSVSLRAWDAKPFVVHAAGHPPKGVDVDVLREIGGRLGKEIRFREDGWKKLEQAAVPGVGPELIAGGIVRASHAPSGFEYTVPYLSFMEKGLKKQVCFLVAKDSPILDELNDAIVSLNREHFLRGKVAPTNEGSLA